MSKSKVRKSAIKTVLGASRKRPAPSHGPKEVENKTRRNVGLGVRVKKGEFHISIKKSW